MASGLRRHLGALWVLGWVWALGSPVLAATAGDPAVAATGATPWWFWPIALFCFCFCLGIVAVLAGVGGGVLYVPLVSSFFPFHLDFVRGVGLLLALAGALAAGPGLLKRNLASMRLAFPFALMASAGAIIGALLGLALPTNIVQISLGVAIMFISVLLALSKNVELPVVEKQDVIGAALGLSGACFEASSGDVVTWRTHRTGLGLLLFIGIGVLGGMFGMGAGWANVPVFNLVLGVPLKISVATSMFFMSLSGTSGVWVYLNRGCVLPLIAVPSMLGLMLGAKVGVLILARAKPRAIRYIVIGILFVAGAKALLKGTGIG